MAESTTLEWSKDFTLAWSDFKAESNPAVFEDSCSVIKFRFTWSIDSDKVDGKIVFLIDNISLYVEFYPLLSWVRPLSQANDSLLNHQQGNFDLAEQLKRENIPKLQEKFYKKYFPTRGKNTEQQKQFAKEDSGKMIHDQVAKLEKLFKEKSLEYHRETNYGTCVEVQSQYDLIFKKLRNNLS